MKTTIKQVTRRIAASLAIATALATGSAWAADIKWIGGSGGSEADPINIYDSTKWNPNNTPSESYTIWFENVTEPTVLTNCADNAATTPISANAAINGGPYTFLGDYKWNGVLYIKLSYAGATSVTKKGDWTVGSDLYLGHSGAAAPVSFTNTYGNLTVGRIYIANAANSTASYCHKGGTLNATGVIYVGGNVSGYNADFTIEGGSVTNNSFLSIGWGSGGSAKATVKKGGSFTSKNAQWGVLVGWGSPGTLNIEGGTVTSECINFANGVNAVGSVVNVTDGGVLAVKQIANQDTKSPATLNIDGGKLKACSATLFPTESNAANLTIAIGANGAEIDSSGYAITIPKDLGGTGAMRFKGGNTITLSGTGSQWTGGTTIEVGTTNIAATAAAKTAILSNLVVDGRTQLATGTYTVLEYSAGGLTDADCTNIQFINCGEGTRAVVADNGTKINVEYVHAAFASEWTLELDGDKNLSEAGMPAMLTDGIINVTVTDPTATLTNDMNVTIGKIVFTDGAAASLVIASGATLTADDITGIGKVTNNGTLVKTGGDTVAWPFNNASTGETVVRNGTLKVASVTGGVPATPDQIIRVKSGATLDMNKVLALPVSVVLEDGANFVNKGGNMSAATTQTIKISLEGDATVTASYNFGLVAPYYGTTRIELGSHILAFNGSSAFWLENTTITGDGTIAVENGTLECAYRNSTGADCTVNIGASGTLRIDNDVTLTVKNFHNGGTYFVHSTAGLGMLVVTGTLTPGNQVSKLTLADGATVKASATTAQVVLTTFSATGAYTIDASEITYAQLNAAEEKRIPILTVPTANKGGTWTVIDPPISGTSAKWVDNGNETSTLYIAKPRGFIISVF